MRRVRPRECGGRVDPSGSCGRGGANWYPSQYPAPADLSASIGRSGCPVGGVARPGPARRPERCTARAGSVPAVGPGTARARRGGRLGRDRIGGEPGHSESETERPAGPGSARRRARAQWSRGGAADWPELGPAAGPGTVVTRRGPATGPGTVVTRRGRRRASRPACSSDVHGPVRPRASSRPSRAAAARPLAGGE